MGQTGLQKTHDNVISHGWCFSRPPHFLNLYLMVSSSLAFLILSTFSFRVGFASKNALHTLAKLAKLCFSAIMGSSPKSPPSPAMRTSAMTAVPAMVLRSKSKALQVSGMLLVLLYILTNFL